MSAEQADQVAFVELASLVDPALLPGTVAAKLGVREQRGQSVHDTLLDFLRPCFGGEPPRTRTENRLIKSLL
jgi:predicted ATPase